MKFAQTIIMAVTASFALAIPTHTQPSNQTLSQSSEIGPESKTSVLSGVSNSSASFGITIKGSIFTEVRAEHGLSKALEYPHLVVAYIYAPFECSECVDGLDYLEEQFKANSLIRFIKSNMYEWMEMRGRNDVTVYPTLILIKNDRLLEQIPGWDAEKYNAAISKYSSSSP